MISTWKKKHPFHWHKKEDPVSKKAETEVRDLEEGSETELIEDLFRLTKDANEGINSLKKNAQQMKNVLTTFEQAHRKAKKELLGFTEEIKTMANEKTLTMDEKRNMESKIISLENQLVLEESHLKIAKLINNVQFSTGISKLEYKIKEMEKILPSSKILSSRPNQ